MFEMLTTPRFTLWENITVDHEARKSIIEARGYNSDTSDRVVNVKHPTVCKFLASERKTLCLIVSVNEGKLCLVKVLNHSSSVPWKQMQIFEFFVGGFCS